jgi:signal transduction histidine kinase/CheY-like chemotaxis protein
MGYFICDVRGFVLIVKDAKIEGLVEGVQISDLFDLTPDTLFSTKLEKILKVKFKGNKKDSFKISRSRLEGDLVCRVVDSSMTKRSFFDLKKENTFDDVYSVSKFPSENPNPVFRISFDGALLYANNACIDLLCDKKGDVSGNRFAKTDLCMGSSVENLHMGNVTQNRNGEKELYLKERCYLFQWAVITEEGYINYYVQDVSQNKENEINAEVNLQRNIALLKNLQGAVLVENEKSEIIVWNSQVKSVLKVDLSKTSEKLWTLESIFTPKQRSLLFFTPKDKSVPSSSEITLKNDLVFKREYIPVYVKNVFRGVMWKFNDISLEKRQQRELVDAKFSAEKSLRFKANFISNMSHEIRTPMNGIIGMSELLRKLKLPGKGDEYVKNIGNCSSNLLTIINDILDLSKIESGKLIVENNEINLQSIVRQAFETVSYLAQKKGFKYELDFSAELIGVVVKTDGVRLGQVLINLLSNAVKFTKEGSVKLVVSGVKREDKLAVCFEVEDTGVGIPVDKQELIFKAFEQAEVGIARKYGGTGLGLSICKLLCDLLGGTIDVVSEIDRGSRFIMKMSFSVVQEGILKPENMTNEDFNSKSVVFNSSAKVLVVDDGAVNRLYAEELLKEIGLVVDTAESGEEAIEKVQGRTYDLILMDLQMPGKNGFDTVKYLRKTLFIQTPVVAFSANLLNGEKSKAESVGMSGFLSKPFYQKDLEILLKEFGIK